MSREIVKVFCARNHRVGTVTADADGFVVDYTGEVWHTDGIFGAPSKVRLVEDESLYFEGYCRTCKKSVHLSSVTLRAAALDGLKDVHATYTDTIDRGFTRRPGSRPLYPPGLTRHRDDPREP